MTSDRSGADALKARVDDTLHRFVAEEADRFAEIDPLLGPVAGQVEAAVADGKRLRSAFCYWGWRAVGQPDSDALVRAAMDEGALGVGASLIYAPAFYAKTDELIESIKSNNLARLTQIPGVGRKTAERLVVDLRDKMIQLSQAQVAEETGTRPETTYASSEDTVRADALSALLNLGYQRSGAEKAIDAALGEGGDVTVEFGELRK